MSATLNLIKETQFSISQIVNSWTLKLANKNFKLMSMHSCSGCIFSFNIPVAKPQASPKIEAVWYWRGCAGWLLGQHNEGSCVHWRGLRGWFPLWHVWRSACARRRDDADFPPQGADGVHSNVSARISWVADVSVGFLKSEIFYFDAIILAVRWISDLKTFKFHNISTTTPKLIYSLSCPVCFQQV